MWEDNGHLQPLLQPNWLDCNHLYVFGKSLHQQEYKVSRKGFEAGLGEQGEDPHIPTGCYELKAINAEIIRVRGKNSDVTIFPNVNTLQYILNVVGAKLKVSFDVPNSLASVFGFNRSIYRVGRQAIEQLVNIMSVNSILVHCNIIQYSYMRGVQAPVVYNFFPNVVPGQMLLEASSNSIYFPVTVDVISNPLVWLTDQHGSRWIYVERN